MIKEMLHPDQLLKPNNRSKEIEITEGNVNHLKNVYLKMKEDFPVDELKNYEHFKFLINKKKYKLLLAKQKGLNEIIGYALVYILDDLKAIWLDYIAIDKRFRGLGYGSLFFNLLAEFKQDHSLGIFMEVEIPGNQGNQNRVIEERRINFYERLGARKVNIDYFLPTNYGGLPMYLYFKPSPDLRLLSKNQITDAISSAFDYIHSDVKNKDMLLKKIVMSIDDEQYR